MSVLHESAEVLRNEGVSGFLRRAAKRIGGEVRMYSRYFGQELDRGSKFHMRDLAAGMKPAERRNDAIPPAGIARIVRAYSRARADQPSQARPYQISGDWEAIIRDNHAEITAKMQAGDLDGVKSLLDNFARNSLSRGLSLSGNFPVTYGDKCRLLLAMNRNYRVWREMTGFPDEVLAYPKEIGNMHGMDYAGSSVMLPAFHQSYYAQRISLLTAGSGRRPVIVEIGGGFGSLAYHLIKNLKTRCTYVYLDIPEMCIVSAYFLMSNFPDKKVVLYGEDGEPGTALGDCDILILPNYRLKDLPDRCARLVFNSHSMSQMSAETVTEYLVQINRICDGFFLHANVEGNQQSMTGDSVYVDLNDPAFELPPSAFRKVYRFPGLIRNDGFIVPEFSTWEYLYERIPEA